jgi:hypothetical protein
VNAHDKQRLMGALPERLRALLEEGGVKQPRPSSSSSSSSSASSAPTPAAAPAGKGAKESLKAMPEYTPSFVLSQHLRALGRDLALNFDVLIAACKSERVQTDKLKA